MAFLHSFVLRSVAPLVSLYICCGTYIMYYNIYYWVCGMDLHSLVGYVQLTKRRIIKWILQHFIANVGKENDNTAYHATDIYWRLWLNERERFIKCWYAKYSFHYIFDMKEVCADYIFLYTHTHNTHIISTHHHPCLEHGKDFNINC